MSNNFIKHAIFIFNFLCDISVGLLLNLERQTLQQSIHIENLYYFLLTLIYLPYLIIFLYQFCLNYYIIFVTRRFNIIPKHRYFFIIRQRSYYGGCRYNKFLYKPSNTNLFT